MCFTNLLPGVCRMQQLWSTAITPSKVTPPSTSTLCLRSMQATPTAHWCSTQWLHTSIIVMIIIKVFWWWTFLWCLRLTQATCAASPKDMDNLQVKTTLHSEHIIGYKQKPVSKRNPAGTSAVWSLVQKAQNFAVSEYPTTIWTWKKLDAVEALCKEGI